MAVEPGIPVTPDPNNRQRPPMPRDRNRPFMPGTHRPSQVISEPAGGQTELPGESSREQPARARRRWIRREGIAPAFWTISSILSLSVNLILLVVVIALSEHIFTLKNVINQQLIEGLYQNFAAMDQAHIRTTIPVSAQVPAKFNLPLRQETTVRLTKDTLIRSASVTLNTGGLTIRRAPTDIILPAGTDLPVLLDLNVPVDQMIPVNLLVKVDIPLNQTDLHIPFVGLQNVVQPYRSMLSETPATLGDALCGPARDGVCALLFP